MYSEFARGLLLGSAATCLLASTAFAQSQAGATAPLVVAQNEIPLASAPPSKSGGQIETVIVTANKRAENSQKVGVAITALDGSTLNQQGVYSFQDLSTRVPGFRFGTGVTGGENVLTMRGIGSQNTTPGGDSPVTYSVDGVTLQATTAVDPEFYDIGNIEVDSGPQGTLQGRNSVGGAVNVTTNHPTADFEGAIDAEIGAYSEHIVRGWLNAPIYDQGDTEVNVRVTGVASYHGRYMTNVSTAPGATHDLSSKDLTAIRGQIDVKFNSDVDLLLEGFMLHNDNPVGTKVQFWETPQRYIGAPFYSSPWVVDNNFPVTGTNTQKLFIATLNWNLGWSTLTNIAGLAKSGQKNTSDGDGSGLDLAYNPAFALDQKQLSDEIRLLSNTGEDDPLKWVVGFIYFHDDNRLGFSFTDTGLNCPFCAYFAEGTGYLNTTSYASYGQADYDFAKTGLDIPLTATIGARYTDDYKYGAALIDFNGFTFPTPFLNKHWGQWTGKGALQWQFNPDLMAYGSISRGYLAGGNVIGTSFYGPEHVWSYEVGVKSEWLDHRLQLNVSAYHEDLVDMQVFIQNGPLGTTLQNAGLAKVNGIETQVVAVPVDDLRINLAWAVTDATYAKYFSPTGDNRFPIPPAPVPGCEQMPPYACSWAGNWLNQTPPYTFNLGVEHDWDTSIGIVTARVDSFWSGPVFFLPDNYNRQRAYNDIDLNLRWTDRSDRYTLEGFVRNAGNSAVISNDGLESASLGLYLQAPDNYAYNPPRTWGIRFGVKF
jgi:iron complex outermembrane receptor protein